MDENVNMNRWLMASLVGVSCLLVTALSVRASDAAGRDLESWVTRQGGEVVREEGGRIVAVDLGYTWTTDADLRKLEFLAPQLERLDLSLTYVSDRGLESLRTFTKLSELNLFAAEFITDAGVAFLRGHPNLERLNLRGTDITDVSLEYIATLGKLKSLDISFTQVNDTGLDHLGRLYGLERLTVGGNKITGTGLEVLKQLPNLKSLDLEGVQRRNAGDCWSAAVTDNDLELIGSLTQLERLELGRGTGLSPQMRASSGGGSDRDAGCRITGGIRLSNLGLARLVGLQRLRSLDISGSLVTAEGLDSLSGFPHLEQLSLWGVRVDDSAGPKLMELTSLQALDLSDTAITDRTLDQLAALPNLRRLYVAGTEVTFEGIKRFEERNPGCQLSWRSALPDDPKERQ